MSVDQVFWRAEVNIKLGDCGSNRMRLRESITRSIQNDCRTIEIVLAHPRLADRVLADLAAERIHRRLDLLREVGGNVAQAAHREPS